MTIFSQNDINIRKSFLLMIIKLSDADHRIDQNEARFIGDLADKLGITKDEITNIHDHPEDLQFTLPDNMLERMQQFYHLLFLMRIDGQITTEEREICRNLGFRLCLNPLLMDDLINLMVDNLSRRIPEGEMLNAVKKYLN
ncbi:MAG: hypothetical protein R6W78_17365 [Bacteroidales bacterium]